MTKTILILDCAKAYGDPLEAAFKKLGANVLRISTDESLSKFESLLPKVNGVVVSGTDSSAGTSKTKLMTPALRDKQKSTPFIRAAIKKRKPLLGICHGYKIIIALFGGTIERHIEPQKGIFKTRVLVDDNLFRSLPDKFSAYKWRRWFVTKLPKEFIPLAISKDSIDAARHRELPIVGIQFHPEIIRKGNQSMPVFQNWLKEI